MGLHLEQFAQQHWYPVYHKLAAKFKRVSNSVQLSSFKSFAEYLDTLLTSTKSAFNSYQLQPCLSAILFL